MASLSPYFGSTSESGSRMSPRTGWGGSGTGTLSMRKRACASFLNPAMNTRSRFCGTQLLALTSPCDTS